MPTSLASSRATRDRMTTRSGKVREAASAGTRVLVERVVEASRTAPVGSRPDWIHDLGTDLLADKCVTVERLLSLAIASAECGANVSTIPDALCDVLNAESVSPVEPLDVAIVGAIDAGTEAERLEVRAMKWTQCPSMSTPNECNALLKSLHDNRDELDDLIRSVARHRLDLIRNGKVAA